MEFIGKRDPSNRGGYSKADYEVMVSVPKNSDSNEDFKRYALSVVFRHKAFHIIAALNATNIERTRIDPTKRRLYFNFIKGGGKRYPAITNKESCYVTRLPFHNKTEYEVAKNTWQGEYDLLFDPQEGYHYIDLDKKHE